MNNCIICKIINKEIPALILYEDEHTMCIMDINPISDGHCIVFPKNHSEYFSVSRDSDITKMILVANKIANQINKSKIGNNGINYLINEKENAKQEIMHLHMHIIPKFDSNEGFNVHLNNKNNKKTIDESFNLIKVINC